MRLLLDTHVLVWALVQPDRIPPAVRSSVEAAEERLVSAASAYEIGYKTRLGKLHGGGEIAASWQRALRSLRLQELPLSVGHMAAAGLSSWEHRDPFDRMLVAQAQAESLTVVTADRRIRDFGDVRTYWQ